MTRTGFGQFSTTPTWPTLAALTSSCSAHRASQASTSQSLLPNGTCHTKWLLLVGGRHLFLGCSESRSAARLNDVNASLPKGKKFETIIADVQDENSLAQMCSSTRIVLNCVGPYRFFGEPVVRACVAGGCHYVDITGEPEFIERMEFKYNQAAKEKVCSPAISVKCSYFQGLVIVSACGFDSIPADMGALFTMLNFPENSFATYIESYLTVDGGTCEISSCER